MKRRNVFFSVLLTLLVSCGNLWASPTTAYEAEMVVTGWLKADPSPLGLSLGRHVAGVETFTGSLGLPAYHIVYLYPRGFVIVSADDTIEAIVGFSSDTVYDPDAETPLGALVTSDLNGRIAGVRGTFKLLATSPRAAAAKAREKWNYLIGLALSPGKGITLMGEVPIEDDNLSDIRVSPLLKSTWGQSDCTGGDGDSSACYNYHTPKCVAGRVTFIEGDPNNYPCGCVATSMAQLMRYHEYPREPVEPEQFTFTVDERTATRGLLRGEGPDGAYNWADMVLSPGNNATDEQRRAIGALCHDAGISVGMAYTADGSGASLYDAAAALVETFGYSNAILGESSGGISCLRELREMINPNLDAGLPVIIGIRNNSNEYGGHAPVCDGYGYSFSTLYHHLNMGWNGRNDCWYNLPDVNHPDGAPYDVITRCIYNVFTDRTGEIISGRIIDSEGRPLRDVVVAVQSNDGGGLYTAATNKKGIYALTGVASDSTYTVTAEKPGYDFLANPAHAEVATEISTEGSSYTGNKWGVDFRGYGTDEGAVILGNTKLTASDGRSGDRFGCSVAISGDYAIVGAYCDDSKRGSAYIFKREDAGWIEQAKLKVLGEERFGFSVAISGDYAVVGAGCNKNDRDTGGSYSAHVFKRDGANWIHQAKLYYASDSLSGRIFGCSVSVSGETAIVGAPNDGPTAHSSDRNSGSAFVYVPNQTTWLFSTRIRSSDIQESDRFASSVSINGDYVIAARDTSGRYGKAYGPVYIFKRDGTGWTEQAKLTSPVGFDLDRFGNSIAISEDCALVGAPTADGDEETSGVVYLYSRHGTTWTVQSELIAQDSDSRGLFGYSVAISGDYIIVGSPDHDDDYVGRDSGSAYTFKRNGTDWTQQAELTAFDGMISDRFGISVAIDGRYAIVGAEQDDDNGSDSGSVYIFERIGSTWMP